MTLTFIGHIYKMIYTNAIDSAVLTIVSVVSAIIICVIIYFLRREKYQPDAEEEQENAEEQRQARRGQAAPRNYRARLRAAALRETIEEEEDPDQEKLGAKKRAKMEAKAEKKAMREVEEREREEKKKKKELQEEERKRLEEKERLDEERREEEIKKALEEKERQEHEEYLKLKASFNIEDEGFDDVEIGENENLLQEFISHIKNTKVLLLEDLASKFHMKTQSVINRIQDLQVEKILTGVIDDRGKFIYISQEELEAVAKFVKQRGRVSIAELAENSQTLINLNPNIALTT